MKIKKKLNKRKANAKYAMNYLFAPTNKIEVR